MLRPSLFASQNEIVRARRRVADPAWSAATAAMRVAADELVADPPELPQCDYAWFDADPDRDYVETYQLFGAYAYPAIGLMARIRQLLQASRVFDEERYAELALVWATYLMDRFSFHVRHHDAGLMYSRGVNNLADAYLYFADRLDGDQRDLWRRQLTAAGEAIMASREHWRTVLARMPYNNHLAHHQAGLLGIAIALDRPDWIDTALNGRGGFAYLLPGCVRDDGLCYESSTVYHFGTLGGLVRSAELVRHHPSLGRDLYNETFANGRSLKQMFDAPLGLMLPNGELPPLGDCYTHRNPMWNRAGTYELGYAVYGDDRYAWLLDRGGPRTSAAALLYGADTLGPAQAPQARSRVWIEHGYALVTSRDGDDYWADDGAGVVAVLTGDLSGIHHQRDSLSLIVAAGGRMWVEDVESKGLEANGFSDPIQEAFNRTVWSHNTVVVDETDQRKIDRPLPIVEFKDLPACRTVAMADPHGALYDGVRMLRSVAATDGYCLDVFQVASDAKRTYDWLTHPRADGPATCEVDWAATELPDQAGYCVLADPVVAAVGAEGATLRWTQDDAAFRADVSAGAPGELLKAQWPTVRDGADQTREMFFYRIRAAAADFAALYQLDGDRPWRIASRERTFSGETHEVRVSVTNGHETREHVFMSV